VVQFDRQTGISACGRFQVSRFVYDRSRPDSYDWNLWEAEDLPVAQGRIRAFCRLRGGGTKAEVKALIAKLDGAAADNSKDPTAALATLKAMVK